MAYNFPEEEKGILKFWEDNKIFEKLRQKNKGKKPWSFLDGPITANNPMGVHHAWGRTYKDLFQRYFAMKGFDQRYQNGFDCQGLHVEVEVEKELGFKNNKDIVHDSVYFGLPLINKKDENLLVWTTTPWTLPANIAVAVDEKIDYTLVENEQGKFWIAKDLVEKIFKEKFKILKTVKGKNLVGLKYSFAFNDLPRVKEVAQKNPTTFHTIISTDDRIMPINTEDGTGLVHTAVSAGQEDFQLGKKLGLPLIEVIGEDASYLEGLGEFSGQNAKKNPKIILDYLTRKDAEIDTEKRGNWVFKILPYKHKYPTCWRCKTELVWRVVDEWYISMDKLRKPLENIVKEINWIPAFGKERELDWIKNMHDWLISKKRYWGLTLPIYECECGHFEVIGSKEELKKRAIEGWEQFDGNSPHRPWVDAVKIKCKKCKKTVDRIKDVGSPWLDAGIAPFSTIQYFSDKKYWKKWFPVDLISESFPGQFKNWFYSLLVMSAVLEETAPMKTIFGYASVRDEKGEEMHKSKGNAIWFDEAVEKIGADPMRWMYMRHNPADNFNFGYKAADEIKRKLLTLYNVYTFFGTYVVKKDYPAVEEIPTPKNILDKWIISKIGHLVKVAEFNLDKYDVAKAMLAIEDFFINDLSLWYLRRSRKRFHEEFSGREEAIETLYYVLLNTAKVIAPAMPFFAEEMYQNLKTVAMPESVHLCDWPKVKESETDLELEEKMDEVRNVVTMALAERSAKAG